ncbi:hypothetical protein NDU88_004069 [Pleurodeles waltl]|uniref:Uncharacterized protein n=1 Tax=Pleurodeles waltl TaxID=8319 RepID=A0AAV7TQ93_PLEWA|nr:hypothetical protein NDU88_004069 [Pleurodeles waltl]
MRGVERSPLAAEEAPLSPYFVVPPALRLRPVPILAYKQFPPLCPPVFPNHPDLVAAVLLLSIRRSGHLVPRQE